MSTFEERIKALAARANKSLAKNKEREANVPINTADVNARIRKRQFKVAEKQLDRDDDIRTLILCAIKKGPQDNVHWGDSDSGCEWRDIVAIIKPKVSIDNWLTEVRSPLASLMADGIIYRHSGDINIERYCFGTV